MFIKITELNSWWVHLVFEIAIYIFIVFRSHGTYFFIAAGARNSVSSSHPSIDRRISRVLHLFRKHCQSARALG